MVPHSLISEQCEEECEEESKVEPHKDFCKVLEDDPAQEQKLEQMQPFYGRYLQLFEERFNSRQAEILQLFVECSSFDFVDQGQSASSSEALEELSRHVESFEFDRKEIY